MVGGQIKVVDAEFVAQRIILFWNKECDDTNSPLPSGVPVWREGPALLNSMFKRQRYIWGWDGTRRTAVRATVHEEIQDVAFPKNLLPSYREGGGLGSFVFLGVCLRFFCSSCPFLSLSCQLCPCQLMSWENETYHDGHAGQLPFPNCVSCGKEFTRWFRAVPAQSRTSLKGRRLLWLKKTMCKLKQNATSAFTF